MRKRYLFGHKVWMLEDWYDMVLATRNIQVAIPSHEAWLACIIFRRF